MTVAEMHIGFQIGVDKVSSLGYPGFEPEEIDYLLNQAQDQFVKTRYTGNTPGGKGFEQTEKRMDDIRNVVKRETLVPFTASSNKPFGAYFNLPNSSVTNNVYWFSVQENADAIVTDCNGNQVSKKLPVKPITHDTYNRIISDPFNKSDETELLRLMNESFIEVIAAPNVQLLGLEITYVRRPIRIDLANLVDCELADHTHQEIITGAVNIALEGIESRRFQTQTISASKQE